MSGHEHNICLRYCVVVADLKKPGVSFCMKCRWGLKTCSSLAHDVPRGCRHRPKAHKEMSCNLSWQHDTAYYDSMQAGGAMETPAIIGGQHSPKPGKVEGVGCIHEHHRGNAQADGQADAEYMHTSCMTIESFIC